MFKFGNIEIHSLSTSWKLNYTKDNALIIDHKRYAHIEAIKKANEYAKDAETVRMIEVLE